MKNRQNFSRLSERGGFPYRKKTLPAKEKMWEKKTYSVSIVTIYDQLSKWLTVQRERERVGGQRDTRTKIEMNGMGN